jgi:excisionase family DNA binding protein
MTVADAAKKIGVSSSKMYTLVSARAISHYRIGGKIVFFDSDVDAYLASRRVGAVTPSVTVPRMRPKLKHLSLRP